MWLSRESPNQEGHKFQPSHAFGVPQNQYKFTGVARSRKNHTDHDYLPCLVATRNFLGPPNVDAFDTFSHVDTCCMNLLDNKMMCFGSLTESQNVCDHHQTFNVQRFRTFGRMRMDWNWRQLHSHKFSCIYHELSCMYIYIYYIYMNIDNITMLYMPEISGQIEVNRPK